MTLARRVLVVMAGEPLPLSSRDADGRDGKEGRRQKGLRCCWAGPGAGAGVGAGVMQAVQCAC